MQYLLYGLFLKENQNNGYKENVLTVSGYTVEM